MPAVSGAGAESSTLPVQARGPVEGPGHRRLVLLVVVLGNMCLCRRAGARGRADVIGRGVVVQEREEGVAVRRARRVGDAIVGRAQAAAAEAGAVGVVDDNGNCGGHGGGELMSGGRACG